VRTRLFFAIRLSNAAFALSAASHGNLAPMAARMPGDTSHGGVVMAYYKVRIEVWCDWDPTESEFEEIAANISAGEAICTKRKILNVVDRPQDIDDEEAMTFFGGAEGDADQSQG
jgi:hypothetical protein